MTNSKPFNRYRIDTRQRLVTTAEVFDRETGEVVAIGETTLSPNDSNDPKLGREIATGRAFKQLLQNVKLTDVEDAQDSADDAFNRGFQQGQIRGANFAAQNGQESKLDYFLEGVRVGHSQHPQITEAIKTGQFFATEPPTPGPLALPKPPVASQVVLNPSPCGPYTKLSYEPGDRVLHINDTWGIVGTVIGKGLTSRDSICEDRYDIEWPLQGGTSVLDYPVKYLKSAPSV